MEIPTTIWRTYRGGRCLYFNLDKISRMFKHSWLNQRGLTWGKMSYRVGDPVIVYHRFKENPLKDKCFCGIITDLKPNLRPERFMFRIWRCAVEDITEDQYKGAIEAREGQWVRKNFLLPYSKTLYRNVLEFLWQVRYLLTEKVYTLFPISSGTPNTLFLEHIQGQDADKFRKEAIIACGFDKPARKVDADRGYKRVNYKKIAKELYSQRD